MTNGSIDDKQSSLVGSEKYCPRPREIFRHRETRKRFDDEDDCNATSTRRGLQAINKSRRKKANNRERSRMREINVAFETLRRAVPSQVPKFAFHSDGTNEQLTKITTLRHAMRYIAELADLLKNEDRRADAEERIDSYIKYYPSIFRHNSTTSFDSAENCADSRIQYFTIPEVTLGDNYSSKYRARALKLSLSRCYNDGRVECTLCL